MFKKDDKVVTKDHTRYHDWMPGNATLVDPQPTKIKGGRPGVVTGLFDNGDGTVSIEVKHGKRGGDFREYSPDEIELA